MRLKHVLQGRFMRHPLHPLFVHFPVALWVVSVIFDGTFLIQPNPFFARASYYCIAIGLVGAVLSTITGLAEYVEVPRRSQLKKLATTHMILNILATLMFLANFLGRRSQLPAIGYQVTWIQFLLSVGAVFMMGVSGYIGGLMVYDFGMGFKPQNRDQKREPLRRIA